MAKTVQQRAYELIRRRLESGHYRPGDRVSEKGLSKELGISTIPVREAISRLTSEGLVDKSPGLGVFVPEHTRAELEELFNLRVLLEGYAVSRAAERITEIQLRELKHHVTEMLSVVRRLSEEQTVGTAGDLFRQQTQADVGFHKIILVAADSPRLVRLVRDFQILTLIPCGRHNHEIIGRADFVRTVREHHRIYLALRRRQPQAAQDAMVAHLNDSMATGLVRFDQLEVERLSLTSGGLENW
jgi:DNA-binding GntR family transcriptional regulator